MYMRKLLFILATFVLSIGLAACSGTETEEKAVESVELTDDEEDTETEDNPEEETEAEDEAEEEEGLQEFDKEIVDNESVTIHLVSVENIVDNDWDEEKTEVTFEVENKRDNTIEVQPREVSADGKMIDDMMYFMSQEVSSGKLADAVLTIENFDGDLPNMENDIEMILHIFDWEDYDFELDVDVSIEF